MSALRFTREHHWVRLEADGTATVGITDHAQHELGDIVFVELPPVGSCLARGQQAAVVESVKSAGEIASPVSGTIVAVNQPIVDQPGMVNDDPVNKGWLFRVELNNPSEIDGLIDQAAYLAHVSG